MPSFPTFSSSFCKDCEALTAPLHDLTALQCGFAPRLTAVALSQRHVKHELPFHLLRVHVGLGHASHALLIPYGDPASPFLLGSLQLQQFPELFHLMQRALSPLQPS